jgi:hypothetical protein
MGATLRACACSSAEERRPSKPRVGGSNPPRRIRTPLSKRDFAWLSETRRVLSCPDASNSGVVLSCVLSSEFVGWDNASILGGERAGKRQGSVLRVQEEAMRGFLFLLVAAVAVGWPRLRARQPTAARLPLRVRRSRFSKNCTNLKRYRHGVGKAARGGQDFRGAGEELLSEHDGLSPRDVVQPGTRSR